MAPTDVVRDLFTKQTKSKAAKRPISGAILTIRIHALLRAFFVFLHDH